MRTKEITKGTFVLSTPEPVSNRSWIPASARGFEPFNIYLVLHEERALLIDTGPPVHREAIIGTLSQIVGSRVLSVMVTRSELECIGNIGAIVDSFKVGYVLGTMKNLPILGLVHFKHPPPTELIADRLAIGRPLEQIGFARFRPLAPVIKTLSTVWVIDDESGTLFTSDFFGADLMPKESDHFIRWSREGSPSRDFIRERLIAKFDWLGRANLAPLSIAWNRFFSDLRPSILAPTLGRIQMGEELVVQTIFDYRSAVFGMI